MAESRSTKEDKVILALDATNTVAIIYSTLANFTPEDVQLKQYILLINYTASCLQSERLPLHKPV
jgi:hypothetical protein